MDKDLDLDGFIDQIKDEMQVSKNNEYFGFTVDKNQADDIRAFAEENKIKKAVACRKLTSIGLMAYKARKREK